MNITQLIKQHFSQQSIEDTQNFHLIAQSEIESAMRKYPSQARYIDSLFMCLYPSVEFYGNQELYRQHCQELLERYARSGDASKPTEAEISTLSMLALSETSAGVKLNDAATLALMLKQ